MSRLTQARGLKLFEFLTVPHNWLSRLTQARGLKQFNKANDLQTESRASHRRVD